MFFLLSKTAGLLTQPLVIVCVLFLAGLLIRTPRRKKALLWSAFALLMFFSNHFLAISSMRMWEVPPVPFNQIKGPYDYAILLTGVARGKVGPMDRVYFSRADRATHTLQLYKLGLVHKVIISGGSGSLTETGIREADELAAFLLMAGMPEEDIVIENVSRNTHDSAKEVAAIIRKLGGSPSLLLVTSGYHMRRSRACFVKEGMQPDMFATDPNGTPGNYWPGMFFVPSIEAIAMWQSLLKEFAGMITYWIAGYI